jgi:hypothetical protein
VVAMADRPVLLLAWSEDRCVPDRGPSAVTKGKG